MWFLGLDRVKRGGDRGEASSTVLYVISLRGIKVHISGRLGCKARA